MCLFPHLKSASTPRRFRSPLSAEERERNVPISPFETRLNIGALSVPSPRWGEGSGEGEAIPQFQFLRYFVNPIAIFLSTTQNLR